MLYGLKAADRNLRHLFCAGIEPTEKEFRFPGALPKDALNDPSIERLILWLAFNEQRQV